MVEWHRQLNGPEFEQALRGSEGQGCCLQSMESQRAVGD